MRTTLLVGLLALAQLPGSAEAKDPPPTAGSTPNATDEVELLRQTVLKAGTEIRLEMLQTVTTEGGSWEEGDEFALSVAEDVLIGAYMIVPKGTLAFGHVRWATRRGAFGKSGKIEIEIDRLVLGGRDIPISGVHRQEGQGELTNAASVISAGPLAGFITGESGTIEKGVILSAVLINDLPVVSPYRASSTTWSNEPSGLAVRARQISVAEAFDALPNDEAPVAKAKPKPTPKRVTVAEAFKKELAGLAMDE